MVFKLLLEAEKDGENCRATRKFQDYLKDLYKDGQLVDIETVREGSPDPLSTTFRRYLSKKRVSEFYCGLDLTIN